MLLKGRTWAIFDSLPDASTDTYPHLKEALPVLIKRKIDRIPVMNWDEESFTRTKKVLPIRLDTWRNYLTWPPETNCHYHLLKALPDKVTLQLKLLPKVGYHDNISKARELLLLFCCADMPTTANVSIIC